MPSHCSGSLNWQKQSKTWDLTVSAQCRFAQSVKLRVQSRPQAQAHHFYVLNWGKHEQCFSRMYLKSFHQDFIHPAFFPALPWSICMTLGKSLSGWAADCSEQATVSPEQRELAFSFCLVHLHLPTMTPEQTEGILNPSQAFESTLQSVLWMWVLCLCSFSGEGRDQVPDLRRKSES